MKKEPPPIAKRLVDFVNFLLNADGNNADQTSVVEVQLHLYYVATGFVFKWYVSETELKDMADFLETDIKKKRLSFMLGEYEMELAIRKPILKETKKAIKSKLNSRKQVEKKLNKK